MLFAILVMAIVAGALAFKVKSPDVCAYTKTISVDAPLTTACSLAHESTTVITRQTAVGLSSQYARTLASTVGETPCPTATTICTQSKTLALE